MATIDKIPKCPPLRFPDFNDDWKETTLGEIASFFSGGTPSTTQKEFYEGDIPFIRSGEIHSKNTEIKISKSALYNSSAKLVEVEDILLALYGATSGDIAISQIRGAINQAILCIRPYCDFNKHYVFYHWQRNYSRVVKKYLQGGQGNLSAEVVKSVLFRYPSLTEQKKIADFLSLIDERIQSCSETLRELKNQKAALLNQLFSQKLRFPDFNDEWTQTTLGEICSVLGGGTPRTEIQEYWNGNIQWFTPSEIGLNKFVSHSDRTITTEGLNNSGAKLLPIGTILLTTRATIGEMSIATTPCTTNQGFQSLVVDSRYTTTEFIYQKGKTLKNELFTRANGSTFKEISATEIRSLPISLPTLAEQKKIADFLSLIDERIEVEEQLLQQYEKQKRYLLKQMFV